MTTIGFLAGQLGDLVMCSVAAREYKIANPGDKLVFAMAKKYAHAKFLFRGLPFIDDFHIWSTYDNFPAEEDREFIELELSRGTRIVNPFPQHTTPDWYNRMHYIEETCLMNGIKPSYNLHCQLGYQPLLIEEDRNYVSLSMFASGNQPYKTLPREKLEKLVKAIKKLGYRAVQIGGEFDEQIIGAEKPDLSLKEAVDTMIGGKIHISIDTSFAWIASAYNHPVIGLYGKNYPDMRIDRIVSHNPVNDNGIYINRAEVKDIEVDEIISKIK